MQQKYLIQNTHLPFSLPHSFHECHLVCRQFPPVLNLGENLQILDSVSMVVPCVERKRCR